MHSTVMLPAKIQIIDEYGMDLCNMMQFQFMYIAT